MSDQLFIHDRYAEIHEIAIKDNNEPLLRVYRSSPSSVTVQIRTFAPITKNRGGKSRNMIANTYLGKKEIRALINFLEEKEKELQ